MPSDVAVVAECIPPGECFLPFLVNALGLGHKYDDSTREEPDGFLPYHNERRQKDRNLNLRHLQLP